MSNPEAIAALCSGVGVNRIIIRRSGVLPTKASSGVTVGSLEPISISKSPKIDTTGLNEGGMTVSMLVPESLQ